MVRKAFSGLLVLLAILTLSCRKDGVFGCNNVLAFSLNGEVFNAVRFSNVLYREFDYYSGVGFKSLVIEAENAEGEFFFLEVTDFREGANGVCPSVEPYYANFFINYCVPGVPFACNQYRAEFEDLQGNVYAQSGDAGQLLITSCTGNGRVNGSFSFNMEDFSTGAGGLLQNGSFSLCYIVL